MNLIQIRQKFVELSGHYDLVIDTEGTDAWKDDGADFYIRAGQDFLDRRANVWKKQGKVFNALSPGDWTLLFQRSRVIEDVFVNTATARVKLTKKDLVTMHLLYPGPINVIERGLPLFYAPAITRTIDISGLGAVGDFFNFIQADSDEYRGIIILPPPSEDAVVEVIGQFYSSELTDDTDESFWTLKHPDILIIAGLYQLETLYHRNTQGANDYLEQLTRMIDDLDRDVVEEEIQGVRQLEG